MQSNPYVADPTHGSKTGAPKDLRVSTGEVAM
jgi:hypothetical protein